MSQPASLWYDLDTVKLYLPKDSCYWRVVPPKINGMFCGTFKKWSQEKLSYNSGWMLLDRGSHITFEFSQESYERNVCPFCSRFET